MPPFITSLEINMINVTFFSLQISNLNLTQQGAAIEESAYESRNHWQKHRHYSCYP